MAADSPASSCNLCFGPFGSLFDLRSIPQIVEGLEIEVADGDAALPDHALDPPEAVPELLVRGAERALGLDAELPPDVGDDQQQVAEFLLSLAIELEGVPEAWALAADTDGIDGSEDNAGAVLAPDTLRRARELGLNARQLLSRNESYGFFSALGDLLVTGPTRTNVNDYRVIVLR
jgi:hydroxypyruvate reductase